MPKRWQYGIVPYAISSESYNFQEKQTIVNALNHINYQTNFCVKFVPRTIETNYIYIRKTNQGCSSMVGQNPQGGMQIISIDSPCLRKDIIIHEATHALGFDHTQSRSDRNNYVTIVYENMKQGTELSFALKKTNNEFVPFDYKSIMMYPPRSFSKNGLPTIVSNDPRIRLPEDTDVLQLSPLDIQMIAYLYQCTCKN